MNYEISQEEMDQTKRLLSGDETMIEICLKLAKEKHCSPVDLVPYCFVTKMTEEHRREVNETVEYIIQKEKERRNQNV